MINNECAPSRLNLFVMSAAIIMLFLAVTWTPVYGFNMSRVDNLTTGGEGSDESGDYSQLPAKSASSGGSGDGYLIFENELPDDGNVDQYNTNCPPPIPEPATLLLIGFGLAGGAVMRRFKR